MDDLPRAARRVVEAARGLGLEIVVRRHPAGTRTAGDAAAAIGCDVGAIVKSLVFAYDGGHVLVLASGANRVDTGKAARALGVTGVRRADADGARAASGFAIGGTPPFGHAHALPTVVDRDLLGHDELWAAAGTPDTVFALTPDALVRSTRGEVADVAE